MGCFCFPKLSVTNGRLCSDDYLFIKQEYVLDMEELSLEAFVTKYQDDLPLHVRVCKGFYGHSERTSVSEGDKFNIHFIKKSQVGVLYEYVHETEWNGTEFGMILGIIL